MWGGTAGTFRRLRNEYLLTGATQRMADDAALFRPTLCSLPAA
jgi:hypothetical protein